MKMNKKLMMGVSAILIAFTGSTLATQKNPIWEKCKDCNDRPEKCAKDEKFFQECITNCPSTAKGDPIAKCRTAHNEAEKMIPPPQPKSKAPPVLPKRPSSSLEPDDALLLDLEDEATSLDAPPPDFRPDFEDYSQLHD